MPSLKQSRLYIGNKPLPATAEQVEDELARRKLVYYAQRVLPTYERAAHLDHLAVALERVERGECKRLMVFYPPRHGKSTLVSQVFPCWHLGKHPKAEIVQSGYSHTITLEHSRKARDIFASEANERIFKARHVPGRASQEVVATERQAAHEWGTTLGGRYRAVGVGGGITGFGADIAIIDDPVKNREEAQSEVVSQRVWDWYTSTLYTRLSPGGAVILVMTRWAIDDLAGRLLDRAARGEGDQWDVICCPAIVDGDKALWPERWPIERLIQTRDAIGLYEWSALYMQEPTIRGGNMFRTDRIVLHDSIKDFPDTSYVRFWDLASTKKERAKDDPDYTAGALAAVTREGGLTHFWLKNGVATQSEAPRRNAIICSTAETDGDRVRIGIESVAGYKDAFTTLDGILGKSHMVHKAEVSGDKVVRAAPLEPIIEGGRFHMMRADWNSLWISQFMHFPNGKHDDCVDACSGAYNMLAKPQPGFVSRASIGI